MSGAPPALRLRPAEPDDFSAIHDIYRHHVLNGLGSFEEEPPDRAELLRRFGEVRARDLPYLVALQMDHVVGYAYAAQFRPRAAYRFSVEDSIYIAPDRVGRGVGRALLTALIERCTARGLRRMIAVIGDSGNAGSIGLHRALGFSPPAVIEGAGFKFDRWVDVVMMQRALGPGATTPPPAGS